MQHRTETGLKKMSEPIDTISGLVNTVSAVTILGTIAGFIPPLAALIAMIWYIIQISESKTIQKWKLDRQVKHSKRRLAKLRAQEAMIKSELAALEKADQPSLPLLP